MTNKTSNYWNSFYSKPAPMSIPSQFAAFSLGEFPEHQQFIDIGCGNGRDALFFARHEKKVLGVDASQSAIDVCVKSAREQELQNIDFQILDIDSPEACDAFYEAHKHEVSDAIVYARFFVHAISESSERNLLRLASKMAGEKGYICLEFRTHRDQALAKETSSHFRRFVNPVDFSQRVGEEGLHVVYYAEGFGFAKYKGDDAHAVRFILAN